MAPATEMSHVRGNGRSEEKYEQTTQKGRHEGSPYVRWLRKLLNKEYIEKFDCDSDCDW